MFDDPSWSLPEALDEDGFLAQFLNSEACFGPPSSSPCAAFCLEPVALIEDQLLSGSTACSSRASSPPPTAAYCSGPRLVTPQVCSGPSSRFHCRRTSTLASLPPLTPAATMVSTFFSFSDPTPVTQYSSAKEQQQVQQSSSTLFSTPASPAPATPDNTVTAAAVSPSLSSDGSDVSLHAPSGSDNSEQNLDDNKMDLSDSEDDDEESEERGSNLFGTNKRKAPEVDWRAITDPAERRRQRRLAKNRVTAARSRDRKKVQWMELEGRLQAMDNENSKLRAMLEEYACDNSTLREQLESLGGASTDSRHSTGGPGHTHGGNTHEPAQVYVFIATLLLAVCFLPGDQALLMLGTALPLLLAAQLLAQDAEHAADCNKQRSAAFEMMFRFLAMAQNLVKRSGIALCKSMHSLLFERDPSHTGPSVAQAGSSAMAQTMSALMARGMVKAENMLC
ncbi:MAG: hypothetical protein WDW38_007585 [Sanguina aurantia]